jgi:hypothetical protein
MANLPGSKRGNEMNKIEIIDLAKSYMFADQWMTFNVNGKTLRVEHNAVRVAYPELAEFIGSTCTSATGVNGDWDEELEENEDFDPKDLLISAGHYCDDEEDAIEAALLELVDNQHWAVVQTQMTHPLTERQARIEAIFAAMDSDPVAMYAQVVKEFT